MDRAGVFRSEGFEPFDRKRVGLPRYVWVLDIDVEISRSLHASEEALLGLLELGFTRRQDLARFLGLEGEALFSDLMIDLVRSGGAEMQQDGFAITSAGQTMLQNAIRKDVRRSEGVRVVYDPYSDALGAPEDEGEELRNLQAEGLEELSLEANLSAPDLLARMAELGRTLTEQGPRGERDRSRLLRVEPVRSYAVYQPAELEVWHRPDDHSWTWRLTDIGEEARISEKVRELEAGQIDGTIIPRQKQPGEPRVAFPQFVQRTLYALYQGGVPWVAEHDLLSQMLGLITGAEHDLTLALPVLEPEAAAEVTEALVVTLERNKALRATLAVSKAPNDKVRKQLEERASRTRVLEDRLTTVRIDGIGEGAFLICGHEALVIAREYWPFRLEGESTLKLARYGGRRTRDPESVRDIAAGALKLLEGNI